MKTTTAAITLVALLGLGACALPSEDADTTRTVTTSGTYFPDDEVVQEQVVSEDEVYLEYLDEEGFTQSDDLLLTAAQVTCQFHREGGSVDQLWVEIAMNPYDSDVIPGVDNVDELPTLMGAATAVYCPEFA